MHHTQHVLCAAVIVGVAVTTRNSWGSLAVSRVALSSIFLAFLPPGMPACHTGFTQRRH